MACVLKFASSEIDVRDDHTGDHVSIRFACAPSSEDYVEIGFNRWNLPVLFEQILAQTRTGTLKELEPQNLDGLVAIEGRATRPLPDGGVELMFHVRTDDGMRSMTIAMPEQYARALAHEMLGWIDKTA